MLTLQEAKVAENTIVIFTSDNGGLKGPTDNTPLRSGKGYAYEGGIRVPLIVRWPGVVAPGTTSAEPVISVDLLPTITQATGVTPPKDRDIDGLSLVEHLKNPNKPLSRESLVWHFPHYRHPPGPYSIIRIDDWKLIKWYEGKTELYRLSDDLAEQNDLAPTMPEKAAELEAALMKELKREGAKLPRSNPSYAPSSK
jgi:arylsulfatase A-like enzyme